MASRATQVFEELDKDLQNLLALHPGQGTPGRPPGDTGPLCRAAVVLLATAWENYVEQVVTEAFAHVLNEGCTAAQMSPALKALLTRKAKDDVAAVTGDGWKAIAEVGVDATVGALNNAGPGQVTGLVHECLGISGILGAISWQGVSSDDVERKLSSLINDLRGDIVHQGKTASPLHLGEVRKHRDFVTRLVGHFDSRLASELGAHYAIASPW